MQRMFLKLNNLCARGKGLFMIGLTGLILLACSSFNSGLSDNNNALAENTLVIEPAAEIPVLDGKATTTGIYIHNYSDFTIQNIQYNTLALNGTQRVVFPSDNGCSAIAAHSSCLLPITTPALKTAGSAGSTLLIAHFNEQQTKQLLNYRYVASHDFHGVSFSGGIALSATSNFEGQYATAFVFGGNHQAFKHVGFYADNNSISFLNNLELGRMDIASDTVMPLEINVARNTTSNNISVTPYVEEEINYRSLQNSLQLRQAVDNYRTQHQLTAANLLQISIAPTRQANLLMSNLPVMNNGSESSITMTIFNNGVVTATGIGLSPSNSDVTVATAASNPCGTSLAAGASCNFKLNLQNTTGNSSSLLTLTYNNGANSAQATQIAYIANNPVYPMVITTYPTGAIQGNVYESGDIQITISNNGGAPLESLTFAIYNSASLAGNTFTIKSNTCSGKISSGASCYVVVHEVLGAAAGTGIIYLQTSGSYNGNNYYFVGKSLQDTVLNPLQYITSSTPSESQTNVNTTTALTLNFNTAMSPTTLNTTNIWLQKVSDGSKVLLTFQGVTNSNQTVTFIQTSGKLSDMSDYQVMINPSAILSSINVPMGVESSRVAVSFTTGDYSAPEIVNYQPNNGSTLQSRLSTVRIAFNESMAVNTLNTTNLMIEKASGTAVTGYTADWDGSEFSIYLNHIGFESTTTYKVYLNESKITDASINNNALGTPSKFLLSSFTTSSVFLPTISSTYPLNGATGVGTASQIQIYFSQTMDTSTINNTTIQLKRMIDGAILPMGNESFNYQANRVTFTPTAPLDPNLIYQIIIPNTTLIKDTLGNSLDPATVTSGVAGEFRTATGAESFVLFAGSSDFIGTITAGATNYTELVAGNNNYRGITRTYNGTLLALSYTTGNGGTSLRSSSDNGATWTDMTFAAGSLMLTNNRGTGIYCYNLGSPGVCYIPDSQQQNTNVVFKSTNNGTSWSTVTATFGAASAPIREFFCLSVNTCYGRNSTMGVWFSNSGNFNLTAISNPSGYYSSFAGNFLYDTSRLVLLAWNSNDTKMHYFMNTSPSSSNSFSDQGAFGNTNDYIGGIASISGGTSGPFQGVAMGGVNRQYYTANMGAITQGTVTGNFNAEPTSVGCRNGSIDPYPSCLAASADADSSTLYLIGGSSGTTGKMTSYSGGNVPTDIVQFAGTKNTATSDKRWVGVGPNGLIVYNADSTLSNWTTVSPQKAPSTVADIACTAPASCVRIAKPNGATTQWLQYSSDSGVTWTNSDFSTTGSWLTQVVAVAASTFIAVGPTQTLRSTDGGVTWTAVNTYTSAVSSIACYQTNCLLVQNGTNKPAYKSTDSGVTWTTTTVPNADNTSYNALYCWGNVCFLVKTGSQTAFQRSTDFGTSWSTVNYPSSVAHTVYDFSCVGKICLAAGYNGSTYKGSIMRSTDYGATWSEVSSSNVQISGSYTNASDAYWDNVECIEAYCWATKKSDLRAVYNTPIYSTDYGASWSRLTPLKSPLGASLRVVKNFGS